MKQLTASGRSFGPFQTVEATAGGYLCDGIEYQTSVLGDATVDEYEGPSQAEQLAAIERLTLVYDGVVQGRLDQVARDFGYGDPNRPEVSPLLHAITYAEEPAVPKFQVEGYLLRAWRSLTWAACWPILQAVRAGERAVPSPLELLTELEAAAPAPTAEDVATEVTRITPP